MDIGDDEFCASQDALGVLRQQLSGVAVGHGGGRLPFLALKPPRRIKVGKGYRGDGSKRLVLGRAAER